MAIQKFIRLSGSERAESDIVAANSSFSFTTTAKCAISGANRKRGAFKVDSRLK